MTRTDEANFTTISNRKLRSTIALREERFDMALAPRFFNGDAAQIVKHSLSLQEVRGSMPIISNFSDEPGNQKKIITGSYFVRSKKDIDTYVEYAKGSIWNSRELHENAISAANRQGKPQKDVEGNITLVIRESKTSVWHKQLLWTSPARYVNRKGKRLAYVKHVDWWPAPTKPILKRYAIKNAVQLLH